MTRNVCIKQNGKSKEFGTIDWFNHGGHFWRQALMAMYLYCAFKPHTNARANVPRDHSRIAYLLVILVLCERRPSVRRIFFILLFFTMADSESPTVLVTRSVTNETSLCNRLLAFPRISNIGFSSPRSRVLSPRYAELRQK